MPFQDRDFRFRHSRYCEKAGSALDRAMLEGAKTLAVIGDCLALAEEFVFIRGEPFQANRTARVQLSRADAKFRAQAVPEAVGESGRRILKDAGRVHELHEARRNVVA